MFDTKQFAVALSGAIFQLARQEYLLADTATERELRLLEDAELDGKDNLKLRCIEARLIALAGITKRASLRLESANSCLNFTDAAGSRLTRFPFTTEAIFKSLMEDMRHWDCTQTDLLTR